VIERLRFSASVEVRAEAEAVFAVVSDLRRKARLNPNIQVIRVELEGDEPIREGSVFSHRFQRGTRIVEYRSRCVGCVPPRLFQSRSETEPPFEVRVTVEPTARGCRLTQEETVEATPELLDALEPPPAGPGRLREVLRWLVLFPAGRGLGAEIRRVQRERVAGRLAGELRAWLEAIREHVERHGARGAGG
jgi:hypothetical protein